MSEDFEDPRKAALRERCVDAVDAAGYTVDADRVSIPYPNDSQLRGSITPDVSSTEKGGKRNLYFVRVDGSKTLPGWLTNIVGASFLMDGVEVYVVAEEIGEQLRKTCEAVGCGLIKLVGTNELDLESEYRPPDQDAEAKSFEKEVKAVRRRLQTKLDANLQALGDQFAERRKVTQGMSEKKRAKYLDDIELFMVRWREWGEELSAELDALAGRVDRDALEQIRERVESGTDED
jgi:hypothetical protein